MMSLTNQEIHSQYSAMAQTVEQIMKTADAFRQKIGHFSYKNIVFTGCGSSFSTAKSLAAIATLSLSLPCAAIASGDLWLHHTQYQRLLQDALVISISRSGRTSEMLNAYQTLLDGAYGAHTVSIICAENSPLGALSFFEFPLPWAFDESVCQTRSVSNLFAAGVLVIRALAGKADASDFLRLIQRSEGYMAAIEPVIQSIAQNDWDHAVVLADYPIAGLCEEGALAFKEISQRMSNQYGILDVRHGPMVLLNGKTLALVAFINQPTDQDIRLLNDLSAKKAQIVAFSPEAFQSVSGVQQIVLGETISTEAHALAFLFICQLAAYYKAMIVGCDPDRPTGLDPWIQLA